MEKLCSYSWPGNIRELRNVIEHAFIIESEDRIRVESFPKTVIESNDEDFTEQESLEKINYEELKTSILDDSELEPELLDDYSFGFPVEEKLNFNVAKETFEKSVYLKRIENLQREDKPNSPQGTYS